MAVLYRSYCILFLFFQSDSTRSLLKNNDAQLDEDTNIKPKKTKTSKKLKKAQMSILAFNRFQHPNRIVQREAIETKPRKGTHHYRPSDKLGPIPEGYKQPNAPPLPFTQKPTHMATPNGGRLPPRLQRGPSLQSLQQLKSSPFPQVAAVSPVTNIRDSVRSEISVISMNEDIGPHTDLRKSNGPFGYPVDKNNFAHPPPLKLNAWRKAGNVAIGGNKPPLISRKSILEITDVENAKGDTEVFESDI